MAADAGYEDVEALLRSWARRWSDPDDLIVALVKGADALADMRRRLEEAEGEARVWSSQDQWRLEAVLRPIVDDVAWHGAPPSEAARQLAIAVLSALSQAAPDPDGVRVSRETLRIALKYMMTVAVPDTPQAAERDAARAEINAVLGRTP